MTWWTRPTSTGSSSGPGIWAVPRWRPWPNWCRELNPDARVETCRLRIDAANVDELVARCPLWLEAMDGAADKRLLVEKVMLSGRRIASASGMGGFGGKPMQKRVLGNLVLVGDFETDILEYPPLAPRVTEAAALLADAMLEFILTGVE